MVSRISFAEKRKLETMNFAFQISFSLFVCKTNGVKKCYYLNFEILQNFY